MNNNDFMKLITKEKNKKEKIINETFNETEDKKDENDKDYFKKCVDEIKNLIVCEELNYKVQSRKELEKIEKKEKDKLSPEQLTELENIFKIEDEEAQLEEKELEEKEKEKEKEKDEVQFKEKEDQLEKEEKLKEKEERLYIRPKKLKRLKYRYRHYFKDKYIEELEFLFETYMKKNNIYVNFDRIVYDVLIEYNKKHEKSGRKYIIQFNEKEKYKIKIYRQKYFFYKYNEIYNVILDALKFKNEMIYKLYLSFGTIKEKGEYDLLFKTIKRAIIFFNKYYKPNYIKDYPILINCKDQYVDDYKNIEINKNNMNEIDIFFFNYYYKIYKDVLNNNKIINTKI